MLIDVSVETALKKTIQTEQAKVFQVVIREHLQKFLLFFHNSLEKWKTLT